MEQIGNAIKRLISNKIDDYLKLDNVIDCDHEAIIALADALFKKANSAFDFIQSAYEFVRDSSAG